MNQETHFEPDLDQHQLAEMIDREGLAFEMADPQTGEWMNSVYATKGAMWWIKQGGQIRLAPGALTEFGLKPGMTPHNPGGLTPERITKGGKYRAVMVEELDGRFGLDKQNCAEMLNTGIWFPALNGTAIKDTIRVPINTPFPKGTPNGLGAPATPNPPSRIDPESSPERSAAYHAFHKRMESETSRTEAMLLYGGQPDNPWVPVEKSRQLERELNAAVERVAYLTEMLSDPPPDVQELVFRKHGVFGYVGDDTPKLELVPYGENEKLKARIAELEAEISEACDPLISMMNPEMGKGGGAH